MADENWERKKKYLFRKIIVDPESRLSPISEGEESLSDDSEDRPVSPLPDLIIEPEPNRHDDPPEVYQELETRIQRVYKRLFAEDRESSVETQDLINEHEEISTFDRNQTTPSTFSHHRVDDRATSADSETLNPTNIFKEIQNVSKSVESKDKLSKVELVNSPIISSGSRALGTPRTNETNLTEADLDFTQIISTARDYTKELQEMLNKTKINETQQSELEFRKSPIVSYGRRALSVEKRSNETELTELDMDFTQVISTTGNKTKEKTNITNSSDTEDERSKSEFGNSITFGTEPLIVDENETNETEETESDIDNTHVISTTVAEIHEEPISRKIVSFETKSPVLIPTLYKKNSSNDFRALPESTANRENESVSDETVDTIRSNVPRRKRSRDTDSDTDNSFEVALRRSAFYRVKKRRTSKQSSDAEINTEDGSLTSEERIKRRQNDDKNSENDSFEMALRREVFERINRRKGFGRASEELDRASGETEVIEEMRGAPQVEVLQAFQRKSTASQESLQGTFAKPSVAEIPEDISMDVAGHSTATLDRTQDEGSHRDSVAQDSPVLSGFTAQTHTGTRRARSRTSTLRDSTSSRRTTSRSTSPTLAEMQEDISMNVAGHSVATLDHTQDEGSHQDSVAQDSPVLRGFTEQTHTGTRRVRSRTSTLRDSTSSRRTTSRSTSPTLAEMQEDISMDVAGHSTATLDRTQDEGSHRDSVAQDSPVLSGFTEQTHTGTRRARSRTSTLRDSTSSRRTTSRSTSPTCASLSSKKPIKSCPTEVKQSSISSEEATPSVPNNNLISTTIWSVSPIPISTADGASNENAAKRRSSKRKKRNESSSSVEKKRKKYQKQFVHASTQIDPWESIRANFFVGTPRIFKLCSCSDHTCP